MYLFGVSVQLYWENHCLCFLADVCIILFTHPFCPFIKKRTKTINKKNESITTVVAYLHCVCVCVCQVVSSVCMHEDARVITSLHTREPIGIFLLYDTYFILYIYVVCVIVRTCAHCFI